MSQRILQKNSDLSASLNTRHSNNLFSNQNQKIRFIKISHIFNNFKFIK